MANDMSAQGLSVITEQGDLGLGVNEVSNEEAQVVAENENDKKDE